MTNMLGCVRVCLCMRACACECVCVALCAYVCLTFTTRASMRVCVSLLLSATMQMNSHPAQTPSKKWKSSSFRKYTSYEKICKSQSLDLTLPLDCDVCGFVEEASRRMCGALNLAVSIFSLHPAGEIHLEGLALLLQRQRVGLVLKIGL
mmetsp:Transcript_62180/g.91165  ORF Transcript_62180/g.91165 Transcript_62180/m.91165 type:complete len:149 (-) Transcript_62180:1231-1677(-)